ncbi:hypothetical protein DCC85_01690 [Paenibacillus sp. CAA11]|uniref:suppressor of fused domain protein n=1 Tax=Paenibacillus sp. CAA11 TaxID=1532905 RepID=UPI000D34894D|nr:suppressor of fused domain protein [Paenibacillus sp. CAA11]AWB43067.1 hypothetical protein DCC85_01690 [Paenibacillus sp. CAA11]
MKPTDYSESGQPIYRYEDQETREWSPAEYGEEGWSEKIVEHFEKHIGKIDMVFHEIVSETIHVDVYHILPTPERNFHTLFTTGMSYLPMNTPEELEGGQYAELMISLPPTWPISEEAFKNEDCYWPVRWLKVIARFVHDYQTWMGFGHTMPNGDPAEPLSSQTKQSGIVLLPPIQVPESFGELQMDEERSVNFYSIVPLYPEEMDFKLKHGINALLERFDEHGITELVDLKRKNVCKPSSLLKFWKK